MDSAKGRTKIEERLSLSVPRTRSGTCFGKRHLLLAVVREVRRELNIIQNSVRVVEHLLSFWLTKSIEGDSNED